MNTLHSPRAGSNRLHLSCAVVLAGLSFTSAALAAVFDAPYELTPPAGGVFFNPANATTFGAAPGQWSVSAASGTAPDEWRVNTTMAPDSLQLSVIDFAGVGGTGVTFTFQSTAVATAPFSFHFTAAYGLVAPQIAFVQNGLDVATNPSSGSFTFPLTIGDTFGFRLSATEGAFTDQASLTIVPEPNAAMLLGFGALALVRRRRG